MHSSLAASLAKPSTSGSTTPVTPGTPGTPADLVIRPRVESDLSPLAALLTRQQAATQYPMRWSGPMETFLVRNGEVRAWVAASGSDVLGHIAIHLVTEDDGEMAEEWSRAHGGVPVDQLRAVSIFFTDVSRSGAGIGRRLHEVAVAAAREEGYPVLDVVSAHRDVVRFYANKGWREVGSMIAPWSPEGMPTEVLLMVLPRELEG